MINSVDNNHSTASLLAAAAPNPTVSPSAGGTFEQQLLANIEQAIGGMGLKASQFDVNIQTPERQILITYNGGASGGSIDVNPQVSRTNPFNVDPKAPVNTAIASAVAAPGSSLADCPPESKEYRESVSMAGYNPAQYADPDTAQWLADLLGGTVTYTASSGPNGPPQQAMISFGAGKEMCAGLLAQEVSYAERTGGSEAFFNSVRDEMKLMGVTPSSSALTSA